MRTLTATLLITLLCGLIGVCSPVTAGAQKKKGKSKATRTASVFKRHLPDSNVLKNIPADAHAQVTEYITRFRSHYYSIRNSRRDYLEFVASVLARYNLPDDLKILSVIESNINPEAVSSAGAVGIWQLMPALAKEQDLSNDLYDERKDMYKSTQAAAKFLHSLHKTFRDRLLIVAAYNCGPARVSSALRSTPGGSFWAIRDQLPLETQNHVLKYLAGVHIFYNLPLQVPVRSSFTTAEKVRSVTVPESPFSSPKKVTGTRNMTLQITASFRPEAIIRYIDIDPETFRKLNPQMYEASSKNGSYELRLPEKYMLQFLAQKSQILKASLELPASP